MMSTDVMLPPCCAITPVNLCRIPGPASASTSTPIFSLTPQAYNPSCGAASLLTPAANAVRLELWYSAHGEPEADACQRLPKKELYATMLQAIQRSSVRIVGAASMRLTPSTSA